MDKENMVYTHSGVQFGHKKNEIILFAGKWMEIRSD
jgi:hypothetical protein